MAPIPPILYGHTQAVSSVAFDADGKVLASGSADGSIRIWDVQAQALIGSLGVPPEEVNSIAFEPRKGILASVGAGFVECGFRRLGQPGLSYRESESHAQRNGGLSLERSPIRKLVQAFEMLQLLTKLRSAGCIDEIAREMTGVPRNLGVERLEGHRNQDQNARRSGSLILPSGV